MSHHGYDASIVPVTSGSLASSMDVDANSTQHAAVATTAGIIRPHRPPHATYATGAVGSTTGLHDTSLLFPGAAASLTMGGIPPGSALAANAESKRRSMRMDAGPQRLAQHLATLFDVTDVSALRPLDPVVVRNAMMNFTHSKLEEFAFAMYCELLHPPTLADEQRPLTRVSSLAGGPENASQIVTARPASGAVRRVRSERLVEIHSPNANKTGADLNVAGGSPQSLALVVPGVPKTESPSDSPSNNPRRFLSETGVAVDAVQVSEPSGLLYDTYAGSPHPPDASHDHHSHHVYAAAAQNQQQVMVNNGDINSYGSPWDSVSSLRGKHRHAFAVGKVRERERDFAGFETINGYVFLDQIGFGTFGTVWVAECEKTQTKFAMKIVDKSAVRALPKSESHADLSAAVAAREAASAGAGHHHGGAQSQSGASSAMGGGPRPLSNSTSYTPSPVMASLAAPVTHPGGSSALPPLPQSTSLTAVNSGSPDHVINTAIMHAVMDLNDDIRREVAIMKRLQHKNIVPLYEVIDDKEQRRLILRMKFVPHGPLLTMLRDGTCHLIDEATAAGYLRQITAGLLHLHQRNIVHRDIKPSNLLLERTEDGDIVYITDFGVSEVVRHGGIAGRRGTPAFFAPELLTADADEEYGMPVDMWALGVTYYCMIVGKHPFFSFSPEEMEHNIVTGRFEMPEKISQESKFVLSRLLTVDHRNRMTCEELRKSDLLTRTKMRLERVLRQVNQDPTAEAASAGVDNDPNALKSPMMSPSRAPGAAEAADPSGVELDNAITTVVRREFRPMPGTATRDGSPHIPDNAGDCE